jgi:hypothetical protein
MKNELIKRAQVGGYVKADTTGTNTNWEVGKITRTDDKSIWFESATDSEIIKISRQNAFKATPAEYDAAKASVKSVDKYAKNISKMSAKAPVEKEDLDTSADDAGDVESELDEDAAERSIVKRCYRANYLNTYSSEGNSSKHNGDRVAIMFEGKNLDEVYDTVARAIGCDSQAMKDGWAHLNVGQQRMLAGNKLRKFLKDQGKM